MLPFCSPRLISLSRSHRHTNSHTAATQAPLYMQKTGVISCASLGLPSSRICAEQRRSRVRWRPSQRIQSESANPPKHTVAATPPLPPSIFPSLLWCLSDVITSQDTREGGEEKWTGTERRKVEGERKCVCVCERERKRKRGGKWTWAKDGAGWTETECRLWGRFERTDTGVSDWRRAAPF